MRCIPIVQVRAGNVHERRGCEGHVHRALPRFERVIHHLPLHRKAYAREDALRRYYRNLAPARPEGAAESSVTQHGPSVGCLGAPSMPLLMSDARG